MEEEQEEEKEEGLAAAGEMEEERLARLACSTLSNRSRTAAGSRSMNVLKRE